MVDIALIGAGAMGANHFRTSASLRDARISAIVDHDIERARALASDTGVMVTDDLTKVVGNVDAAIIATPTPTHTDLALQLLASGVHVLVEKPIADDLSRARAVVQAAAEAGLTLMVGHVERFNPVILEFEQLLDRPLFFEAARVSPYTDRITDGVVLDLMVHDIDIVLSLARSSVRSVTARTLCVRGSREDAAWAIIEFDNGMVAQLTASRLGQDKIRSMSVTEADRVLRADLIKQDLSIHRVTSVAFSGAGYREAGMVEIPFLQHRGEPLFLEQWHFVEAVQGRRDVKVSGVEAVLALEIAHKVLKAAER
jgi:UDP-N-acetylglucosamine 3-dehydrogenase